MIDLTWTWQLLIARKPISYNLLKRTLFILSKDKSITRSFWYFATGMADINLWSDYYETSFDKCKVSFLVRKSHRRCPMKKFVLKNLEKLTGKHMFHCFLIKFGALGYFCLVRISFAWSNKYYPLTYFWSFR